MWHQVHDLVGVGFGPANIALAIALEEFSWDRSVVFLERRPGPQWQPNMLLDGADIQNNPLRDLVTPRNPKSHYTFINFLHQQGRLFEYLNLGFEFPLRKDYAQYVSWVAGFFDHWVRYGESVDSIELDESAAAESPLFRITTAAGDSYLARSLVLAPGRTPLVPTAFENLLGDRVFHLNDYLPGISGLARSGPLGRVCVVGGSQSAIEIVLDLERRFDDVEIINIMRGYSYRLKDTSPFSEHVYFPEFVDYFYSVSHESKLSLNQALRHTNYSSADSDVIHKLYATIYEQKLDGRPRIEIWNNSDVRSVRLIDNKVRMRVEEVHTGELRTAETDCVVLATGFRNLGTENSAERLHPLLEGIADRIALTPQGFLHVNRDYSLAPAPDENLPPIYANGLCETSHGFGDAGSFSLLSLRAWKVATALANDLESPETMDAIEPTRHRGLKRPA